MLKATKLKGICRINIILFYGYELRDEVQLLKKNWLDTKTTIKLCVASPLRAARIMLA